MKIGDRVKRSDVNEQSIPAFKALRGSVVGVNLNGNVKIQWDGDKSCEFGWRDESTVCLAEEEALYCAPSE